MKIRQGFVTNSSSSSFIAKIRKQKDTPYYDEENETIRNLNNIMGYGGEPFGATIELVSDKEDLDEILKADDSNDIKWLLNDYIMENEDRSFRREEDIIKDLEKELEKNNFIFIDADRSCTSGSFLKLIKNYIGTNKIGEIIHYYSE